MKMANQKSNPITEFVTTISSKRLLTLILIRLLLHYFVFLFKYDEFFHLRCLRNINNIDDSDDSRLIKMIDKTFYSVCILAIFMNKYLFNYLELISNKLSITNIVNIKIELSSIFDLSEFIFKLYLFCMNDNFILINMIYIDIIIVVAKFISKIVEFHNNEFIAYNLQENETNNNVFLSIQSFQFMLINYVRIIIIIILSKNDNNLNTTTILLIIGIWLDFILCYEILSNTSCLLELNYQSIIEKYNDLISRNTLNTTSSKIFNLENQEIVGENNMKNTDTKKIEMKQKKRNSFNDKHKISIDDLSKLKFYEVFNETNKDIKDIDTNNINDKIIINESIILKEKNIVLLDNLNNLKASNSINFSSDPLSIDQRSTLNNSKPFSFKDRNYDCDLDIGILEENSFFKEILNNLSNPFLIINVEEEKVVFASRDMQSDAFLSKLIKNKKSKFECNQIKANFRGSSNKLISYKNIDNILSIFNSFVRNNESNESMINDSNEITLLNDIINITGMKSKKHLEKRNSFKVFRKKEVKSFNFSKKINNKKLSGKKVIESNIQNINECEKITSDFSENKNNNNKESKKDMNTYSSNSILNNSSNLVNNAKEINNTQDSNPNKFESFGDINFNFKNMNEEYVNKYYFIDKKNNISDEQYYFITLKIMNLFSSNPSNSFKQQKMDISNSINYISTNQSCKSLICKNKRVLMISFEKGESKTQIIKDEINNVLKSKFLITVSHEIHNPFSAMNQIFESLLNNEIIHDQNINEYQGLIYYFDYIKFFITVLSLNIKLDFSQEITQDIKPIKLFYLIDIAKRKFEKLLVESKIELEFSNSESCMNVNNIEGQYDNDLFLLLMQAIVVFIKNVVSRKSKVKLTISKFSKNNDKEYINSTENSNNNEKNDLKIFLNDKDFDINKNNQDNIIIKNELNNDSNQSSFSIASESGYELKKELTTIKEEDELANNKNNNFKFKRLNSCDLNELINPNIFTNTQKNKNKSLMSIKSLYSPILIKDSYKIKEIDGDKDKDLKKDKKLEKSKNYLKYMSSKSIISYDSNNDGVHLIKFSISKKEDDGFSSSWNSGVENKLTISNSVMTGELMEGFINKLCKLMKIKLEISRDSNQLKCINLYVDTFERSNKEILLKKKTSGCLNSTYNHLNDPDEVSIKRKLTIIKENSDHNKKISNESLIARNTESNLLNNRKEYKEFESDNTAYHDYDQNANDFIGIKEKYVDKNKKIKIIDLKHKELYGKIKYYSDYQRNELILGKGDSNSSFNINNQFLNLHPSFSSINKPKSSSKKDKLNEENIFCEENEIDNEIKILYTKHNNIRFNVKSSENSINKLKSIIKKQKNDKDSEEYDETLLKLRKKKSEFSNKFTMMNNEKIKSENEINEKSMNSNSNNKQISMNNSLLNLLNFIEVNNSQISSNSNISSNLYYLTESKLKFNSNLLKDEIMKIIKDSRLESIKSYLINKDNEFSNLNESVFLKKDQVSYDIINDLKFIFSNLSYENKKIFGNEFDENENNSNKKDKGKRKSNLMILNKKNVSFKLNYNEPSNSNLEEPLKSKDSLKSVYTSNLADQSNCDSEYLKTDKNVTKDIHNVNYKFVDVAKIKELANKSKRNSILNKVTKISTNRRNSKRKSFLEPNNLNLPIFSLLSSLIKNPYSFEDKKKEKGNNVSNSNEGLDECNKSIIKSRITDQLIPKLSSSNINQNKMTSIYLSFNTNKKYENYTENREFENHIIEEIQCNLSLKVIIYFIILG